jgi:hypothetical protein
MEFLAISKKHLPHLIPIRKNNRGISGVERLRTPVTGILIVGLQLSLDLPRDGEALEPH